MADPAEQGEPVAFGEVVDAATPRLRPGVSKEQFLDSLRHAARTGGHAPGGRAPDVSMPVVTDLSGGGVRPEILKALGGGARSLEDVQAALAGPPPDPFTPRAAPAIATAEMWQDLVGAGIPADHVDAILGHMLASYAAMEGGSPLADAQAVIGRLLAALGDGSR